MIYLDNGATTFPKPKEVVSAMEEVMEKYGANPGRGGHDLSIKAGEIVYNTRELVGDFFGCQNCENVMFTNNATVAINMAIKGILKSGDHVIISSFEHNAVSRPCYKLKESGVAWNIAYVYPQDRRKTVESFKKYIKSNTKMIICNHVSNVFGNVLPIEELGELAREHGILFMVDASQSAGVIPIDMEKNKIDILCSAGHKSLYGPQGTGILINGGGIFMDTLIEGGTGSNSQKMTQPDFYPDRMESGTVNTPGIAGLGAGISFINNMGILKIGAYEEKLREYLAAELKKIEGVTVYDIGEKHTGVLSFAMDKRDCEGVAQHLNQQGIAVRSGLHCAPLAHKSVGTLKKGTVRVSVGLYNTQKDIENVINAVKLL